jgi:hypothetical protein
VKKEWLGLFEMILEFSQKDLAGIEDKASMRIATGDFW